MDFFKRTLDPVVALAAIAVLDIFMFVSIGAWTVGGGETMMTGLMAQAVIGDELQRLPFWNLVFQPDASYWKIYISLGMLFGGVVGAVCSSEFRIRAPKRLLDWVLITTGGLLMSSVPRPAFNLSKQTIDTPVLEMFARMLVGVRGDRVTGIDNPLSDRQILGLLEYYRSKQ